MKSQSTKLSYKGRSLFISISQNHNLFYLSKIDEKATKDGDHVDCLKLNKVTKRNQFAAQCVNAVLNHKGSDDRH